MIMMVLSPFIVHNPDHIKGSIEQSMVQYVLPEFTSQERHLWSMACEVFGVVTKASITRITEENLNNHSCAVTLALDIMNSVCVQAALAITELFVLHNSVRDTVSLQVGKVMQDLLKLSDGTDLDIFNHRITAWKLWLTDSRMSFFLWLRSSLCTCMYIVEGLAQQKKAAPDSIDVESLMMDGDDDKVYSAMGVAKTIGTVQEVIIPIIWFTLENKLIDALTFCLHAISPNMWPVFELTYDLFKSNAVYFLDEMLPLLDNFVLYGTEVLKAWPDYRLKVLDMYRTAMTSPQLGDNDKIHGCKLAESMLLNFHGHVDDQLQDIITIATDHIDKGETASFHLANLKILINAALYNASSALHFMEAYKPGFSCTFFKRWSYGSILFPCY
ncbi:hypothetical protein BD769DRAFT_1640547 [Suillus cothurnatus]|nr:hypothetical protein BD769DRAFT_1640547 [Suillus cothurnatus]